MRVAAQRALDKHAKVVDEASKKVLFHFVGNAPAGYTGARGALEFMYRATVTDPEAVKRSDDMRWLTREELADVLAAGLHPTERDYVLCLTATGAKPRSERVLAVGPPPREDADADASAAVESSSSSSSSAAKGGGSGKKKPLRPGAPASASA